MEKEILIETIKENAGYFIDEVGECFPFAICVNEEEEIIPIYLNEEEDFPDYDSMIEEIKFCVEKALDENSFSAGCIAYDEVIVVDGKEQNAIRIHYYEPEQPPSTIDFPYVMEKDKAVFLN